MIQLEFSSIDYGLSFKIAKALNLALKQKGLDSHYIDQYGTTMAKVVKLIRTHEGLTMPKQSKILIDAAREWEVRQNFFSNNARLDDKFLIYPQSFYFETMAVNLSSNVKLRKTLNRHILKKLFHPPEYIIYLTMSYAMAQKVRAPQRWKRKIETSLTGDGLKARLIHAPRILSKLTDLYDSKCCIIEVVDLDDTYSIVKQIIDFINENPSYGHKHTGSALMEEKKTERMKREGLL